MIAGLHSPRRKPQVNAMDQVFGTYTLPHAGALPVAQPPPAGDRAAAAELADRQQPPGHPVRSW